MSNVVSELCLLLVASASRIRLYGPEHPLTIKATQALMDSLENILRDEGVVRIAIGPNEVYFNDTALPAGMGPSFSLTRRLADKGIGLLEFRPGVTPEEVGKFCVQLENPRATEIASQPHLRVGEVTLAFSSNDYTDRNESNTGEMENLRVQDLSGDRTDDVAPEVHTLVELQNRVSEENVVAIKDYEQIVKSFVAGFAGASRHFLPSGGHPRSSSIHLLAHLQCRQSERRLHSRTWCRRKKRARPRCCGNASRYWQIIHPKRHLE